MLKVFAGFSTMLLGLGLGGVALGLVPMFFNVAIYALELLVEGIAQMGVLIWRVAGEIAKAEESAYLQTHHITQAFGQIIAHSNEHKTVPVDNTDRPLQKVVFADEKELSIIRTTDVFS